MVINHNKNPVPPQFFSKPQPQPQNILIYLRRTSEKMWRQQVSTMNHNLIHLPHGTLYSLAPLNLRFQWGKSMDMVWRNDYSNPAVCERFQENKVSEFSIRHYNFILSAGGDYYRVGTSDAPSLRRAQCDDLLRISRRLSQRISRRLTLF